MKSDVVILRSAEESSVKRAPARRRAVVVAICLATSCLGCRFSRSGSQAIDVDPFAMGTGRPAVTVADGAGYDHGVPLDAR